MTTSAVVVVLALVAGGFGLARLVRSDSPAGPWHSPLWSNWSAGSIEDACTVGICVGDTVALPLGRPVESVVDLAMPEELGALSIERAWIGEQAGLFGAGWATVWDVRLVDGKFVGPLPAVPTEAPRRGHRVALEGGATVHVDDQGRLDEVCPDAAVCTRAEWSDDALVLRSEAGSSTGTGRSAPPVVRLTLRDGVVSRAASSDGRRVRYGYESGRLASVARGTDRTVYGYDSGRLASIDDGVRRTYSYDRSGQVVATSDLDGGRWTITRPAPKSDAAATGAASSRTFEVHSPDGWTRTYQFTNGALVKVVDADRGVLLRREIAGGRVRVEERPLEGVRSERVAADELRVTQQQGGGPTRVARYWFDDAGRLTRTESAEGLSRIRYQGRSERPTDVRGPDGTRRFDYDRQGLLVASEDADGYRVEVERNGLGQPVAITDGVQRTEFAYDAAGRTKQQRTGGKTTTASYRDDGLVDALTSPTGSKLAASYDDRGRLQTLGGADAEPTVDTPVDQPAATGSNLGTVKTVKRSDGTFEQRYRSGETAILDDAGRPVAVTVDGRTESRRYDDAGHLVELRPPGGPTYKLTHTTAGRVASITDGTVKAKLTWHGNLLMSVETDAGSSYQYDFDEAGRVVTATSGPLRWDYTYDKAGRSSVVRGPSGVVETRWDEQGRPVEVRDGGHVERYRWTGDKLDLARVDIDGEAVLGFRRNDAGKIREVAADTGTVTLGYDSETGAMDRYRVDDSDEVTLTHDRQGRVVTIKSGDRTETWKWAKGKVAEVRVDGEEDPYRLGWLAPGLLGDVKQGDDHLLRTKVDAAGRPTKLWAEDDLAATLSWNRKGLAKASIDGQPTATFKRDDEHRPIRVQVGDRRIDWAYKAGALARVDDSDQATTFEYSQGRLNRTVHRDGGDKSTITWDPSHARPKTIDTTEGDSAFTYRDGKVQAMQIDGENQQIRYQDDKPTADGDAGDILKSLFNETGQYRSALGQATLGPAAPWITALPEDVGVALPEVVTGRQFAEAAIDAQLPNTPGFLLDDSKNLAKQTALGLVASAAGEPAVVGPDQVIPSGLEVGGNDLQLDFAGTADGSTAVSLADILGPGPGLVERVVDFGRSLVGALGHRLQAIQRLVSENPVGHRLVTAAFMIGSHRIGLVCGAAALVSAGGPLAFGACSVLANAGLRGVQALVTSFPGLAIASSVVAAAVRPYGDLARAIQSADPLGAALAAYDISAELVPAGVLGTVASEALSAACGLRRLLCISATRFGSAARHVADAQRNGAPRLLRLDRTGAAARRFSALRDLPARTGLDRDEYPFALSSQRSGLSIRYLDPASNRSLGAYVGNQLQALPDGARFFVLPVA